MNANQVLQQKLLALEEAFRQKLPARIEEITHALHQLVLDPGDRAALEQLHRALHTMAGSAGTFGFDALGAQARVFEARMRPCLEGQPWPEETLKSYINDVKDYFSQVLSDLQHTAPAPAQLLAEDVPASAGRLIYLFDGDPAQSQAMAAQLEQFGFEVAGYDSLGGLMTAIARRRPDVLVIELPAGGTAEAAQAQLLQRAQAFRIPSVFMSNVGGFANRLLAVRTHGDAYFTKPVDVVALSERIDAMLSRQESKGYRILIIDDDAVTAGYYSAILAGAGMQVQILSEPERIFDVMSDFRPELLLLDVYMPQCSGIELSRIIRQDNAYLDIPIVFLSSETDPDKQLEAVRAGADDFLCKPIAGDYLISALATRAERYRALRGLIMRDGLTGLYNHSAIKERLAAEVTLALRKHTALALAMIDLDNFKRVNDSYGHPAGDQVLRALARLLRQRLRRSDLIGRYGGEEFMVIFPGTDGVVAQQVLDQVRLAFGKICHHADAAEFFVNFSAGVADIEITTDTDELIDAADAALYRSKQAGRNRITQA